MSNHVVIMAGGIGSRFWPISTPEYPKQFIDILGCGKTLIQMTFERFSGIASPECFWVVTNKKYVDMVRTQLPQIPEQNILAEPVARNTAPCIAWVCEQIRKQDSTANIVVTPSDAIVSNTIEFQRIIRGSLTFTEKSNSIVTVGIRPNRPEIGYGYIQISECTSNCSEPCKVSLFKEKPDLETAKQYVSSGNYLWNAGIFIWNVNTISKLINQYNPELSNNIRKIISTGNVESIFHQCEAISIDYAVMEPAAKDGYVYTYPADFGWSDLGNWQSLHEKLKKDEENNAAVGNVHFFDSTNNIVHTENLKRVIIQGLDGYIVSEKNGQLLICKRSEEQRIKKFSTE